MPTYGMTYDMVQLMTDFKSCADTAGFCTVKFGPPEAINFDHDICYDLLNIDYPTSYVSEGIREVYTFDLILARPVTSGSLQGVQVFDDDVTNIFANLEIKMWNMFSCLALGISGGGGCNAYLPKHKITINRSKGMFNDNLVTLQVRFDVIAQIAATVDPCGGGGGGGDEPCLDPCAPFYGVCGCTDPGAINYDVNATFDDGTCCFPPSEVDPCNDPTNFPPVYPEDETGNPL